MRLSMVAPPFYPRNVLARRAALLALTAALAAGAAGCKESVEVLPEAGQTYYPVAVGNFWIYAVTDSTWSMATPSNPVSRPTATSYQFRETVTETFTDAAGQPAYRLVRAKRASSAASWMNDSVFVLSATAQSVVLNRNNSRTLELIFPVREGRSWNFNAYNNNSNDTVTAETRRYSAVDQPYTTGGGNSGLTAITYPTTVTTTNAGSATESSLLRLVGYQQVFAKGVGPVLRRRVNFAFLNYVNPSPPYNQIFPPGAYTSASTRRETLVEYGPK